ncbi:hypothetical protein PR048_013565 [Dryococelus australis]|uniref:Uncharacterized protein n=1 Tax=Dryococelus australis TaxID=614101 RepID=A0ABQ9HTC3_9NEOP|nr:hypothetical protein PR048_013565 [Dryococelus australis]
MFINTLSISQWSVASWVIQEKDTSGEDEGNDDDEDGVTDIILKMSAMKQPPLKVMQKKEGLERQDRV